MSTPSLNSSPAPAQASELALRISPLAGWVLAFFLAAGLLSNLWWFCRGKVDWLPPDLTADAILHGEVTHKLAKQLSSALLPQQAAGFERGASWLLLNDSGPRVRQGCPGWLFIADEFKLNRQAQANAQAKAAAVIEAHRQLRQRGVQLLLAVVPDKSRIASEQLCGLYRPGQFDARISTWVGQLQAAGVDAMDLTPALQTQGAQAFLRTDTHWSEEGANAAALALAGHIQASGFKATPQQHFDSLREAMAPRPGDLVRLAGLDGLPLSLQPPVQSVAATRISAQAKPVAAGADNLDDLFGDDNLPNVALIGTSFSHNSSFSDFLQYALGAPLGNFAKDGGEFSGAATAYFSSPAFRQTPPKLLVWEIPERDLQTPYGEEIKWAP
jgi:alginate O-acetyltransferase complex protein AlgJ